MLAGKVLAIEPVCIAQMPEGEQEADVIGRYVDYLIGDRVGCEAQILWDYVRGAEL